MLICLLLSNYNIINNFLIKFYFKTNLYYKHMIKQEKKEINSINNLVV